MTSSKIWYVVIDGKADGPHTEDQVREWLRNGKINYAALVYKPGLARWVTAAECKEFERRNDAVTVWQSDTAVKLDVPKTSDQREGWVALVKHAKVDGSNHYIQSGPYTTEQILERLASDQMKYEDHVWQKGFKNWTPISDVKEFERRRDPELPPPLVTTGSGLAPEPALAPAPAPAFTAAAAVESGSKANAAFASPKTSTEARGEPHHEVVTATATDPGPADAHLSDPQAEVKHPEGSQGQQAQSEETQSDDHEVTAVTAVKRHRPKNRRLVIAATGATLAMALVYAGISSYKETLRRGHSERIVASDEAPIPPPPPLVEDRAAPVPAAPVVTEVKAPVQVPVDPEVQNPPPKEPTTLKVVALKETDRPQLALETDLPAGSQITVAVSARPGSILKFPTYLLNKKVIVEAGQMPSVDLSKDHLPSGNYRVNVESGKLRDATNLAVGLHDSTFNKKIAAFRKVVAKQAHDEKVTLNTGFRFVASSYQMLSTEYRKSKTNAAEGRKKWSQMIKAWRKDYEKELKAMKSVNESARNHFVYPEQLLKLKSLNQRVKEMAAAYEQSLKSGRSIASDDDPGTELKDELKRFRTELGRLK